MLLHLFVGSVLPYIQVLDSWLYQGILDDPFGEVMKKMRSYQFSFFSMMLLYLCPSPYVGDQGICLFLWLICPICR